jgi:hypothetical protein
VLPYVRTLQHSAILQYHDAASFATALQVTLNQVGALG